MFKMQMLLDFNRYNKTTLLNSLFLVQGDTIRFRAIRGCYVGPE